MHYTAQQGNGKNMRVPGRVIHRTKIKRYTNETCKAMKIINRPKLIKNEQEYKEALERIEQIQDAVPGAS